MTAEFVGNLLAQADRVPPQLRVLVTTAPARVPALPDTPTMAELGTKGLTFIGWFGLLAPAGTPQDILDRLNAEAKAIGQTPAYRERMQKIHVEAVGDSPAEFKALTRVTTGALDVDSQITAKPQLTVFAS
jgi:tripartite-type tricarboxylate transporter receptor subunit TctC